MFSEIMTDKPHIFEMRSDAIIKFLAYSFVSGSAVSLLSYFMFRQSWEPLNVILIGFATGVLIAINFLTDDYRGAYILAGVFGTIAAGVLIVINFEDPFLIGFAPLGGLFGAIIILLPDVSGY